MNKYNLYIDELKKWNKSINLVDHKSLVDAMHRHIDDSLQLIEYINCNDENIIDLGSGAGFPGMVLAIEGAMCANLIEPVFKKAAFLEHIKNCYSLENIKIHNCQWQQLKIFNATLVVSRAFCSLKDLLFAMYFVSRETYAAKGLFLKGEKLKNEILEAQNYWNFEYEIFQSKTHQNGKIIKIGDIQRK